MRLGHYRLADRIGEGGMGVVWRAEDSKLRRDVAVKVLPQALAADPERLARLEQEARSLASLNHTNVASIYGFDEQDGQRYLILEFVPGETLEQRIARGPLGVDEAAGLAMQVASGLEAAHNAGILHRDLKPANIKITPEGEVKVLDFGLAKAMAPAGASGDVSLSPTLTQHATVTGTLMGTASYMSPEQARAHALDRRTDLWSFGCVLFEMLTGHQAFPGETVSDIIARILQTEPDWSLLPRDLPRDLDRLLRRCLTKDRKDRARDAGEARLDIRDALERRHEPAADESTVKAASTAAPRRTPLLAWALVAALATLVGVAIGRFTVPAVERAQQPAVARLDLPVPSERPVATGSFLNPLAVSPDGRNLVYVGVEQGIRQLYRRPLDQLVAEPIPGTEGAEGPFFSPDGEEVAFWAEGQVQRVSLAGGLPRPVFTSTDFRGGVWAPDGTIIASPSQSGPLCRVSAAGGECTPLTADGPGSQHRLPSLLPDGRILFGIRTGERFAYDNAGLAVLSLETGEVRAVADGVGMDGRYAAGHLFYVQANSLIARPFDLERLDFTGPPRTVRQGVQVQSNTGAAQFALTPDGSLAFLPGEAIGDDIGLARVDRDGSSEYLSTERDVFRWPSLTADGSQLTVLIISEERGGRWVTRLDEPGLTRMPLDIAWPAWAPDGRHVAVRSSEDVVPPELYYIDAFEGGERTTLFTGSPEVLDLAPTSISPDGRYVLFGVALAMDNRDVYGVEVDDPSSVRPFLETESLECGARFSPDGQWVAYVSNATGRFEVYVTDWPANRIQRQISTDGGREPLWSPRGDELFYRSGERMMAARMRFQRGLDVETPHVLFTGDYEGMLGNPDVPNYEVAPDGRFLMLRSRDLASTADRIAFVRHAVDAIDDRPLRAEAPGR
jgi:Tol biopolymer transport system component